jgi:hypothetical protein
MKNNPVKYVKKNDVEETALEIFPSAGPNASVIGMKNKFWGKNAYVIKVGVYIYKVTEEFYNQF